MGPVVSVPILRMRAERLRGAELNERMFFGVDNVRVGHERAYARYLSRYT